jgi:hypothetical protein
LGNAKIYSQELPKKTNSFPSKNQETKPENTTNPELEVTEVEVPDSIKKKPLLDDKIKRKAVDYEKFDQKKKSGSLYGDIDILPLIKLRFSYRVINLIDTFYDKINTTILDYYKIIDEYNITQEKIERKKLYDLLAEQQGDLTSMDKFVRQQFSQFIAKSGLFLTDICDNNGIINNKFSNLHIDSALKKEINILLYIAE